MVFERSRFRHSNGRQPDLKECPVSPRPEEAQPNCHDGEQDEQRTERELSPLAIRTIPDKHREERNQPFTVGWFEPVHAGNSNTCSKDEASAAVSQFDPLISLPYTNATGQTSAALIH